MIEALDSRVSRGEDVNNFGKGGDKSASNLPAKMNDFLIMISQAFGNVWTCGFLR